MRLDRLRALVAAVDADRRSPLADAAAGLWGLPAGSARYVRTSATCVYATAGGYLRLGPVAERPAAAVRVAADATAALVREGAPVVAPRASLAGRFVEVLPSGLTGVGDLHATLVDAAPGRALEMEELALGDVERWGRAIGLLHEAGRRVDRSALPGWPAVVRGAVRGCGDAEVTEAVDAVLQRSAEVLGPPDVLVHGDAQPDNAGWTASGPVLFDLDDMAVSWAIADLAMAARDAQPIDVLDRPVTATPTGLLLLRGYRRRAELDRDQERAVPLVQRLSAAVTYARLRGATPPEESPQPEPDWLATLRGRLTATADRLRVALLAPLS